MDKNSLNTNKQFMIGNGMLAFGVFAVIIIFLYMSNINLHIYISIFEGSHILFEISSSVEKTVWAFFNPVIQFNVSADIIPV